MKTTIKRLHKPSGLATCGLVILALLAVASMIYSDRAPSYAQAFGNAPIGTVVAYAGEVTDNNGVVEVPAGSGWLLCNGAAVRRTQFPTLFAAIRAAHGNGSDDPVPATDFNLPDLRGLFIRGVSGPRTDRDPNISDADRPPNHPGGNSGNRVGSVQPDMFGEHGHGVNDPGHTHPFAAFRTNGAGAVGQAFPSNPNGFGTDRANTGITIQNSGGRETRPKNAYVHYIIRAQ